MRPQVTCGQSPTQSVASGWYERGQRLEVACPEGATPLSCNCRSSWTIETYCGGEAEFPPSGNVCAKDIPWMGTAPEGVADAGGAILYAVCPSAQAVLTTSEPPTTQAPEPDVATTEMPVGATTQATVPVLEDPDLPTTTSEGAVSDKPDVESPCHTCVFEEDCFRDVRWAMNVGVEQRPEWYTAIDASSCFEKFQLFLYERQQHPRDVWDGMVHHPVPVPCGGQPVDYMKDDLLYCR